MARDGGSGMSSTSAEEIKWAHLDIAGPAWTDKAKAGHQKQCAGHLIFHTLRPVPQNFPSSTMN